jgi:glycosyltransferase involved in cell wall biosynthesis
MEASKEQIPAISIIIPAYNAAAYIVATLQSVLAQTYQDFEVVVVNDGSPDTKSLEKELEPFLARITYIAQQNTGPSGARNAAIHVARGEYLAFLDSDDLWAPGYLEVQTQAFRNDPSLVLHYVDALLFGNGPMVGRTFMDVAPSVGPVTLKTLLTLQCRVNTSCAMVRRRAVLDAGLFDEHLRYSEDFDLWVRLAQRGQRIGYLREVMAFHRLHDASLTASGDGLLHGQIRAYQKVAESAAFETSIREIAAEQITRARAALALSKGKQRLMEGEYEQARIALDSANMYYRSWKLWSASIGLLIAPRVLRRAYGVWGSLLTIRARRKASRLPLAPFDVPRS